MIFILMPAVLVSHRLLFRRNLIATLVTGGSLGHVQVSQKCLLCANSKFAAKYCSLRVFHQVKVWMGEGESLKP